MRVLLLQVARPVGIHVTGGVQDVISAPTLAVQVHRKLDVGALEKDNPNLLQDVSSDSQVRRYATRSHGPTFMILTWRQL